MVAASPAAKRADAPAARMWHGVEQSVEVAILAAACDTSGCTGGGVRNEKG